LNSIAFLDLYVSVVVRGWMVAGIFGITWESYGYH
jgi:hypothetical protein